MALSCFYALGSLTALGYGLPPSDYDIWKLLLGFLQALWQHRSICKLTHSHGLSLPQWHTASDRHNTGLI